MFKYTDFNHFVEILFWKNKLNQEPIDFEESVYYSLKNLDEQNIVYLEAFISPWDYTESKLLAKDIVKSAINGVNRSKRDFGINCRLIIDITRDHGHETAINRLDEVSEFLGDTVIGIGLGGSEQKFPTHLFKSAFKEAKSRGFHVVAHAGEVSGPESIWSAIKDLKVERIGHGVRAIEDKNLINYLSESQVPLEVCVNSNIKTGVYSNYQEHSIKKLIDNGLLVTINSDDPTMFGATLTEEFVILYEVINLPLNKIIKLMNNSIEASFATDEDKKSLRKKLNSYWIQNIANMN
jgi:adenosine deaminase